MTKRAAQKEKTNQKPRSPSQQALRELRSTALRSSRRLLRPPHVKQVQNLFNTAQELIAGRDVRGAFQATLAAWKSTFRHELEDTLSTEVEQAEESMAKLFGLLVKRRRKEDREVAWHAAHIAVKTLSEDCWLHQEASLFIQRRPRRQRPSDKALGEHFPLCPLIICKC